MKIPKRLLIIILAVSLTTLILGCMEEVENDGDGNDGDGGNDGGGENDGEGGVYKAMDVEVINIEYQYDEETANDLDLPILTVDCEAVNYGGPGWCTVALVANGANSSITMKQVIGLESNEQHHLQFWGKMSEEPVNITSYVERELLYVIQNPQTNEMDVDVVNTFKEIHGWLDENQTELQTTIYTSAINYGQPGYITLVVDIEGRNFTKTVEERIYINWYQSQDLSFDLTLPGYPVNATITTKRPQPD